MDKSKSKIEKIVYFVRHGQSADNVAPVFQSPDSPLNEKGQQQAESIAQRVSKLSFDALIASPFERAKQTAEAIAKATGKKERKVCIRLVCERKTEKILTILLRVQTKLSLFCKTELKNHLLS